MVDNSGDTISNNSADNGNKKVLVKFAFTNHGLIPRGINLVFRQEGRIENKHGKEAKELGINQEEERRDRWDTGQHEKFDNILIIPIWNALKGRYKIGDIHYFYQTRSTGMKKPVVVVTFCEKVGEKERAKVRKETVEDIEKNFVFHGRWRTVHKWKNPNGITTWNCLGRQPDQS